MSWESIKETAHKAWSEAKERIMPNKTHAQKSILSPAPSTSSDFISSETTLKQKEEIDNVKIFSNLIKEREAMPFTLYQTPEQSKRTIEIREQLDEIGYHIFNNPKLMETAKVLGLESTVNVAASSFDMKRTQAKEKALGLDQGIGYEMSLTRDSLFDGKRNFPKEK